MRCKGTQVGWERASWRKGRSQGTLEGGERSGGHMRREVCGGVDAD